ncbi:MAG: 2-dehydropantoate 2-reductase [Cloacibacillus sp.]
MKYLIIGAGGVGGTLAAYMGRGGFDVTLIARGAHLAAIKTAGGVTVEEAGGFCFTAPLAACEMENYDARPDVIFICVKGYSMPEVMPFIERAAAHGCAVIPLLNIYGTGSAIARRLPAAVTAEGCVYIASQIKEPGKIAMNGKIFRVVFGLPDGSESEILTRTADDLRAAGIETVLSRDIKRDAFRKFTFVSAMAACGQYHDVLADAMQRAGEERRLFTALVRELVLLADASGIKLPVEMEAANLKILDALAPDASTSMQRDIRAGGRSEIDGLVYEVPRMAKRAGASAPLYEKITAELKARGL